MKKFLKNIVFFILPLIVVSAFFEYKTRTLDSYYKDKKSGLEANLGNIEILVLGNSHAADGIDPYQFDHETYNIAFKAQTLFYDEQITLKYLDRMPNLKYVLINLSYQTLYLTNQPHRDIFYHYFYDIDFDKRSYLKEDLSYFYFGYGPDLAINNIFDRKKRIPLRKGWISYNVTNYSKLSESEGAGIINRMHEKMKKNIPMKEIVVKDLENFVSRLIAEGITPVFVTTPKHENLVKQFDPEYVISNKQSLEQLLQKHKVEYWNYLSLPLEDSDYFNISHLNESGARKFSSLLNKRINKISNERHFSALK